MPDSAGKASADPSSTDPSSAPVAAPKLGGAMGVLNDLFEIYFDHSVPRLAQPGVKVCQCRPVRGGQAFAFICDRTALPRIQTSEKYLAIQNPAAARLIGRGVILCPDGVERYTLVYDQSLGQAIVPDQGEPSTYGMKHDVVFNAVILPIVSLLQDMHNADLIHGGIRVNNLFDGGVRPLQKVVLGDPLARAYGSTQPTLYLPAPVALAQAMGRGVGERADDMYALGVTAALLLRTHDPMIGKSEQDILASKLEFGTFSTLIGNERIPSNLLELLRGLLQDDPYLRWSAHDVMEWLEGRRANPKQGAKKLKASRHIQLESHKILLPSIFAVHAANNPAEAAKLIDNGELKQWMARSISDNRLDERFEMAIETTKEYGRGIGFQDRLICRLCCAFDPSFPLMFRTVRSFPDSFGHVLAEMIMTGKDPKPIADLITEQTIMFWLNMQAEMPSDVNLILAKFEQCQQFLKQRTIGYGIERCLYFLAPDVPCLSPKLRGFYVDSPEGVILAMNEIAQLNDRPETIFDRHIVAFLSVRDRKAIDAYLPDLNASEKDRQIAGTINTLAEMQMRGRLPAMPALTKWLHKLAEPLYDRFHDRDLRASMRKKMNEIKDTGIVAKMAELMLGAENARRDLNEFKRAMNEYYLLRVEEVQLTQALENQASFGSQAGREAAALIAGVLMALIVAGLVIVRLNNGAFVW